MNTAAPARRTRATVVGVVALTAFAFATRFFRLGAWGFDSDETFTLRDSLHPQLSNPRPLIYFLNYFVVRPFRPLDEFSLRLLPALFGVLAIPVFFWVARRLVGTRAALLGALLLTFNPLHVYYSQFARYWTLVFLLSIFYPFALYRGLRERDRAALAIGLVAGATAALAHPTAVLLVGGLGLWAAFTYLPGVSLTQLGKRPAVRWGAAVIVAFAIIVVTRFIPMLRQWIVQHDDGYSTEFLLHLPGKPGAKQLVYLLSYAESLTFPLVLMGLLGIGVLWQGRDRSLAWLLTCLLVFPALFLTLLSLRTPVSTFYLVPTIPVFFVGAGVLLDELAGLDWALRPRWLLSAAIAFLIIAAGLPTLVSQYRDGRRYDYRGVAEWLQGRLGPGDQIVSDQPKALSHYLPHVTIDYLRGDPSPLDASLRGLRAREQNAALWIVMPAPAHAFRANPKLTKLYTWIYGDCQLRETVGVGRMDFRQYYLQIYRCPAAADLADASTSP